MTICTICKMYKMRVALANSVNRIWWTELTGGIIVDIKIITVVLIEVLWQWKIRLTECGWPHCPGALHRGLTTTLFMAAYLQLRQNLINCCDNLILTVVRTVVRMTGWRSKVLIKAIFMIVPTTVRILTVPKLTAVFNRILKAVNNCH